MPYIFPCSHGVSWPQAGGEAGLYWPGALLLAPSPLSASLGHDVWGSWRWFQTADSYLMPTVHMVRCCAASDDLVPGPCPRRAPCAAHVTHASLFVMCSGHVHTALCRLDGVKHPRTELHCGGAEQRTTTTGCSHWWSQPNPNACRIVRAGQTYSDTLTMHAGIHGLPHHAVAG